jgi:hypothetical protein
MHIHAMAASRPHCAQLHVAVLGPADDHLDASAVRHMYRHCNSDPCARFAPFCTGATPVSKVEIQTQLSRVQSAAPAAGMNQAACMDSSTTTQTPPHDYRKPALASGMEATRHAACPHRSARVPQVQLGLATWPTNKLRLRAKLLPKTRPPSRRIKSRKNLRLHWRLRARCWESSTGTLLLKRESSCQASQFHPSSFLACLISQRRY